MAPARPTWHPADAAARARAYSPSSMLTGDLAPFIAAYRDQSAAAYAMLGPVQTLRYGPGPAQSLDLVLPASTAPVALHVFIHGGYWQELSKTDSFFAAPQTLARGIGFAALDYPLAPQARLEEIVADCQTALRHLHGQAADLGIDPARIVVSGSSAGAHLAASCLGAVPLAGLILLSGVYDLRPLIGTYINDALGLDPARAASLSPLLHDPPDTPPALIAWGAVETEAFKQQSQAYAAHLRAAGSAVKVCEIAGRNHFDIVHDLAGDTGLGAALNRFAIKGAA